MATFESIARRAQLKADNKNLFYDMAILYAREAENNFIGKTFCTEKVSTIDTDGDYTYDITGVVKSTKIFKIAGDKTAYFTAGITFVISGSTANDSTYTVVSSEYKDPNTEITVSESPVDETVDGSIVRSVQGIYELPSGFVKEFRVEWNGVKLEPLPQNVSVGIHQSDGITEQSDTPSEYWIIDDDIRLLLKPSSHGILKIWHCYRNTDESASSPIIPSEEHLNFIDYIIASLLEYQEQENRAVYYWNQYKSKVNTARIKYRNRRFKQNRVVDILDSAIGNNQDEIRRGDGIWNIT